MTDSTTPELGFIHRHVPGAAGAPALLLLHGTGGNENDLLPLAEEVAPGWAVLAPRGKVLENGMPRFFRRFGEGVFDLEDVARRADELAGFISAARRQYGIPQPFVLGFSNGANIAAAMMLRHPDSVAGAALLRAQATIEADPSPDLGGTPVLLLSGASDPIISRQDAERLLTLLTASGAVVQHETLPGGHGLTQSDLEILKGWLDRMAKD